MSLNEYELSKSEKKNKLCLGLIEPLAKYSLDTTACFITHFVFSVYTYESGREL